MRDRTEKADGVASGWESGKWTTHYLDVVEASFSGVDVVSKLTLAPGGV